jgi:hypothetical protein
MGIFKSKKTGKTFNMFKDAQGQEVITELPDDLEPINWDLPSGKIEIKEKEQVTEVDRKSMIREMSKDIIEKTK